MKNFLVILIALYMVLGLSFPSFAEIKCNKQAGYTEIKDSKCYNPKTQLSYKDTSPSGNFYYKNIFYFKGIKCGENCDFNGKNCKTGFCNAENCAKGYTELRINEYEPWRNNFISEVTCYNPSTQLSYGPNDYNRFYYKGKTCGYKCDFNGKNCRSGICNVSDCAAGYTELKKYEFAKSTYPVDKARPLMTTMPFDFRVDFFSHNISLESIGNQVACYNPNLDMAYYVSGSAGNITTFARDNEICGIGCDYTGKNCKIGLCNAEECPKGYKQFYHGACQNEKNGKLLIYVSENKYIKFRNPLRINKEEQTKEFINSHFGPVLLIGGVFVVIPIVLVDGFVIQPIKNSLKKDKK